MDFRHHVKAALASAIIASNPLGVYDPTQSHTEQHQRLYVKGEIAPSLDWRKCNVYPAGSRAENNKGDLTKWMLTKWMRRLGTGGRLSAHNTAAD